MTVYVDTMRAAFRGMIMCHMIADNDAELQAMAEKIHIKRRWFQRDHYDISLGRRLLAISHGAVVVTSKQLAAMNIMRRENGSCGDPATARFRVIEHRQRMIGAGAK